jgi:drug efflux transport system permease protein
LCLGGERELEMIERIRHIMIKEFLQTLRDPRMRFVLIAVPVLQSIVFGYAVTTDVKQIAIAIMDRDNTPESRKLVSDFASSHYFRIVKRIFTDDETRDLMDHGAVKAVLQINTGFGGTIRSMKTASAQMILDGTDSNTAGIVLNYAGGVINKYNMEFAGRDSRAAGGVVDLRTRAWFNENLESRNFYVPGVIALLLSLVTLLLSSMAIVREKEIGTIEQIIVTPITKAEFILGKTVPFALIGFFDVFIITGICVFWFKVPIRGSMLLLLVCTALFIMSTIGIGLLLSTVSSTQQQAMMGNFFFFFPAVLLSGFLFPIANMPQIIQWLTYLNPLRYMLVIIRGIFLKGIGVEILWPQMVGLAALGTSLLVLATRQFKKTMS